MLAIMFFLTILTDYIFIYTVNIINQEITLAVKFSSVMITLGGIGMIMYMKMLMCLALAE